MAAPTILAAADKRIVLASGQFSRPFDIPTWTTLRIALRLIMNNTAATITTPRFYVGLSSGSANIIMDANTDNWCGMATSGSWSYFAGPPKEYFNYEMRATKRVGSTITDNATPIVTSSNSSLPADGTTANRTMLFVDITKGSPNYTINVPLFRQLDAVSVDVSVVDYQAQAAITVPSFTSHSAGVSKTLAVDETTGVFNHVCIGWDQATPTIEICDLELVKFA